MLISFLHTLNVKKPTAKVFELLSLICVLVLCEILYAKQASGQTEEDQNNILSQSVVMSIEGFNEPPSDNTDTLNESKTVIEREFDCNSQYSECAPIGKWEFALGVGVGVRTNPLFDGDNSPLILLPSISYYGERFFLDNLRAGFTVFDNSQEKTNSHMLNLLTTISLEQVFFEDSLVGNFFIDSDSTVGSLNPGNELVNPPSPEMPPGEGFNPSPATPPEPVITMAPEPIATMMPVPEPVPEPIITITPEPTTTLVDGKELISLEEVATRKTALLAGLEYQYNVSHFSFSTQLLNDVSSVHDGYEFRFGVSQPFSLGHSDFGFALGALWQDRKLLDYYYGIDERDTEDSRFFYTIDEGGWSPFTRLDWRYQLNKKWSLVARVQAKMLADVIIESPLIEEDFVFTGFLGGVYRF